MNKIRAIIFDFDGVIVNNYEQHYNLSEKKIINITREEHRKLFEGNIHVEREKLKHRDTGFDLMKVFSDSKKTDVIDNKIKEILESLSNNYLLGVITSGYEYGINNFLKNNDLSKTFSFVYGYETDKIKIHKFEKALKEFNLTKDECIFVTDTLGDILEANEVGIRTIAVDFGFHERERLQKGNPTWIVSSFRELYNIILNI